MEESRPPTWSLDRVEARLSQLLVALLAILVAADYHVPGVVAGVGICAVGIGGIEWLRVRRQRWLRGETASRLPIESGVSVVLSDAAVTERGQVLGSISVIRPGRPTGTLPVRLDIRGLRGDRDGLPESLRWFWIIDKAALVAGPEPVVFRVRLTIPFTGHAPANLEAENGVVSLSPGGHVVRDFHFFHDLRLAPPETRRDPVAAMGGPAELVLTEVGRDRELRVPFAKP